MASGVTVYKSTDANAPVLNGTAGSLVTVLDAVLVNGYGDKTAAGWSIAYTGTNKRIYRAPDGTMRGFYRVQDDAPTPAVAAGREARIKGSETASAIDTQVNTFPSSGNGIICRKATYADTTAVPWICVADRRTVYFFNDAPEFVGWTAFMFGEYFSLKSSTDNYNGMTAGRTVEQAALTTYNAASIDTLDLLSTAVASVAGHYIPRNYFEIAATSFLPGKQGNAAHSAAKTVGLAIHPNPVNDSIHLAPVTLTEPLPNPIIRGRMRGFWHFLHPISAKVNHGDTWSGTGDFAGKTFIMIKPSAAGDGCYVLETSDTWETN